MAKTQEELNDLKNEYESVTNKLRDLTEEELKLVTGSGISFYSTYYITGPCGYTKEIKKMAINVRNVIFAVIQILSVNIAKCIDLKKSDIFSISKSL